jgi:TrpR-related protein YerC/YecD
MSERMEGAGAWRTRETRELFDAILALETMEEAEQLFRDLCTLREIEAMTHRWQVARLVAEGLPYHEVSRRTGASTTTVTRVAYWLRHGEGGYSLAIERRKSRTGG